MGTPHRELADLPFSRRELSLLAEHLDTLHQARTFAALMNSALDLLQPFFVADGCWVGFTEPTRRRHLSIRRPDSDALADFAEPYRKLAAESPMLKYWLRTGNHDRVLRRSDCCDPVAHRQTALYSEVDRPLGVNQHMGTWLRPGTGGHFEASLTREGRTDFSQRDVLRLGSLRRHIFRAYENVCELSRLQSLIHGPPPPELPPGTVELQDTTLTAHVDPALSPAPSAAPTHLTPREREVLHWIVEGKTNVQIGIILGASWRTIRAHCQRIFQKLNVETRTTAAVRAMEMGFKL